MPFDRAVVRLDTVVVVHENPDLLALALARLYTALLPDAGESAQKKLGVAQYHSMLDPGSGQVLARVGDNDAAVVLVYEGHGSRAALVGVTPCDCTAEPLLSALLRDARVRAKEVGRAVTIVTGGPAGAYVVSGIDARDRSAIGWYAKMGFFKRSEHVDLIVRPPRRTRKEDDPRIRRADHAEIEVLTTWVARSFAPAWGREMARALTDHQGVFVAGPPGAYQGFAAHSGNNAAAGTFGPIGIASEVRGAGLGTALARAALVDLVERGFARVTIPWVHYQRIDFYRRLVDRIEATVGREVMQWTSDLVVSSDHVD